MININLDTNKELKEGLLRLGFKKKCGAFQGLRPFFRQQIEKDGIDIFTAE